MEAKDLMIGDWVFDERYCTPHKISLEEDFRFCCSGELCFKPIPITAEIIEKNGFSRFFSECKMRYDNGIISIVFSINKIDIDWIDIVDNEIGNIHLKNIRYVHELQHALRLCGLNELADNFKI